MAKSGFSYSESHDYSKNPPRKRKRRAGASGNTPFVPGPPPDMSVGFLPKNLSEEQRRELRARQLAASQFLDPNVPNIRGPLPDPDLDLGPITGRGDFPNQFSPVVPPHFQEINGPQDYARTKTHILGPEEEHEEPFDPDKFSRVRGSLELIAAVSADDREILAFDNKMSDAHMALRSLRQAGERMVQSVARQDENKGKEDSVTSHAKNIVRLLSTVIEPWYNVLEEEFEKLLNETTQVTEMEGEEGT